MNCCASTAMHTTESHNYARRLKHFQLTSCLCMSGEGQKESGSSAQNIPGEMHSGDLDRSGCGACMANETEDQACACMMDLDATHNGGGKSIVLCRQHGLSRHVFRRQRPPEKIVGLESACLYHSRRLRKTESPVEIKTKTFYPRFSDDALAANKKLDTKH